jgi:acyl carrier protein
MQTDTILDEFAEIVFETTRLPKERVTLDQSFRDDLDIDSLSMVEIATAAEDKFGVSIPDDDLGKLKTVRDAVDYIANATAKA